MRILMRYFPISLYVIFVPLFTLGSLCYIQTRAQRYTLLTQAR